MELTPYERFIDIISNTNFLVLATCGSDQPWAAPLYFAFDEQFSLYFISRNNSKHVIHIRENDNVGVAIYDSSCIPGECDGIQIQGIASELSSTSEIVHAAKVLFTRRWSDPIKRGKYFDASLYKGTTKMRLYRIKPVTAFVVDKTRSKDYRIEVEFNAT